MAADPIPRCGDIVLHLPSRETWVVAWAEGNDLAWTGWQDGIARLSDCAITKRCSDAEHREAVRRWQRVTGDTRPSRIMRLYGAALESNDDGQ